MTHDILGHMRQRKVAYARERKVSLGSLQTKERSRYSPVNLSFTSASYTSEYAIMLAGRSPTSENSYDIFVSDNPGIRQRE